VIPYLIIGNPQNRRVGMFQDALRSLGRDPAEVVSWRELLTDVEVLRRIAPGERFVRIDAAGEDAAVERLLLRRGFAGAGDVSPAALEELPARFGQILHPRQAHAGFLAVLDDLAACFAERPAWKVLNPPATIAELFDKRVTSRRFEALGVPVPERLEVDDLDALRAAMEARAWPSVYVKLSCGSSASCLAIYTRAEGREDVFTTIEQTPDAWFNSLRPRRVTHPARVAEILAFLLGEGAQVERAVAKARLAGRHFDTRVLVVAGEPAFTVVRTSRHPITNLHLGGTRGDPAVLADAPGREAALDSCRRIGRHYAGALHVGVDLMYEPGLAAHRVLEANAFGDLLPGLRDENGHDVYQREILAAEAYPRA
jgi:glutathione synthase/RimK-type ligase-like ATP-grasp enzyme